MKDMFSGVFHTFILRQTIFHESNVFKDADYARIRSTGTCTINIHVAVHI